MSWPLVVVAIIAFVASLLCLLPRRRVLVGAVKAGKNQGERIGARTANLDVSLAQGLKKGLYACRARVGGAVYRGLLYYGFNSLTKTDCLEAHLLNFSGDLYGQELRVTVGHYIRPEKKFATPEELSEQVKKDLAEAQQ